MGRRGDEFDTQAPSASIGRDYSDNTDRNGELVREVIVTAVQKDVAGAGLAPPGSATMADFERLDMRVGRVLAAEPFPAARKPAYRLTIDFGPSGIRRSSAQLPGTYPDPTVLVGRLVVAVVNFPARNVAGFASEVVVLGALSRGGQIPLLSVDEGASPGDRVG